MKKVIINILILIGILLVFYLINPIVLPIFNSPIVVPNFVFKTCPDNYSYEFFWSSHEYNDKKCIKNKKECQIGEIWTPKEGDCTPNMIGCAYDSPCHCNIPEQTWVQQGSTWICETPSKTEDGNLYFNN